MLHQYVSVVNLVAAKQSHAIGVLKSARKEQNIVANFLLLLLLLLLLLYCL